MYLNTLEKIAAKFETLYIPEPNSGCWLWEGYYSAGYGQIAINKKYEGAHRVSYLIHKGDIPTGEFVCHNCDNPACVNPEHLFLGTHRDNMRDRARKGRSNMPKGVAHWNAKLSEAAVVDIRTKRLSPAGFAALYGISPKTVSDIVLKKRRK